MLAVAALFVRVGYAALFMRGYAPNRDADSYLRLSKSLADGHGFVLTLPFGFSHASAIRPPLYPAIVSAAFRRLPHRAPNSILHFEQCGSRRERSTSSGS